MTDYLHEARKLFEYSRALRRDFHRHPELGFQEFRTAEIISQELTALGLEVTVGIAGTGVVGILEGKRPGKTILLRFDMDALPISELNETSYASQNSGVMHACGHDGHVAIGLTAAKLLASHRNEVKGVIKFVFQPAEEGLGGASGMISEGVLENPKPDYCLALHLWNERPVGWVSVVPGPLMAGAELFQVVIQGKGGHGALPHQTHDPIVAAAQIVSALQSIIARNVSPLQTAVISVTYIHAGDAYNVIPQTAELRGTIRTFDNEVRDLVIQRFMEVVHNISIAMGCTETTEIWRLTPALVNHPIIAASVEEVIRQKVPTFVDTKSLTMVSEDMAEFLNRIPGCFIMVGSSNEEKGLNFAHHHPRFDFDEEALVNGAGWICSAAIGLFDKQPSL
jgi:amidohydrolase